MKSPQELKREAEIRKNLVQQIKGELETLVRRAPPWHSQWSYQVTLEYKKAMLDAHKAIASERITPTQAALVLSTLKPFYKPNHPWSKLEADKCD